MKPVLKYFYFILFIFITASASAQNMAAVNKVLSNQNLQFQTRMQLFRPIWGISNNPEIYNPKYTYQVTMADGTQKEVSSKIYADTAAHKNYLLFIDKSLAKSDSNRKQKIYPFQTKNIARDLSSSLSLTKNGKPVSPKNYYTGIAKDSCWMFKVITGPINVYSILSVEVGQAVDPSTIVGIQLNDGPILNYNEENLKGMIVQDAEAMEYIGQKNYLKAIKKYNKNIEKAPKDGKD
ncbi:hypothetical protein [Mucilaginibacter endophyticus]|uniref:hypothetical protein n=1 Tax=Mucilaginibacter endophyticus TaxID=2675003 RepID=UPI000E0D07BE|nr:hypothetical protein [Mucilaginibacter endophyticus]